MTVHNQHRTNVCFYFEVSPGAVPVDAAAWATAEAGSTGFRMSIEEGDPSFIRGDAAVENADMQTRVFLAQRPHKGLPTADGGSLVSRVWGTGSTYSAATQVAATGLGRLLVHALGAGARGDHTVLTAAGLESQTEFDLTTVTNLTAGMLIAIASAGDPDRFFPVQVIALDGNTVVTDRELPFTIAEGDEVLGVEHAWPDQAALTNPADAGSSTLSILYQKGPHVWVAGGAHLALTEVTVERGEQPKLGWEVHAARGYPQGAGAPAVPTFTGSIEGLTADVQAIGRDTKCFYQVFGTEDWAVKKLYSATITPGVPILPQDTVTEAVDGMPGRGGYRTEPAATLLELVVDLNAEDQARWVAGSYLTVTYFQVAPAGFGWAVHCRKCFLAESPELVLEGTNRYTVRLQATEDEAGTTEAMRAKVIFARY